MKKFIFIGTLILVAVVSFVLGHYINHIARQEFSVKDKNQIIHETKEALKRRLIEAKIIMPEKEEIFSLSGKINEVGNDYLIIVPSAFIDPLGDVFPAKVKITINQSTTIEKWTAMTSEEYEKLTKPFKDRDCSQGMCNMPDPFYKEKTDLSEIKQGDYLWEGKATTNIKGLDEFDAQSIAFGINKVF